MKNPPLEPSLLSIFRLFLGLQFGLVVLIALSHAHLGQLSGSPFGIITLAAAGTALLLGYLSWPGLPGRLGRGFLPLALILSVLLSLLIQNAMIRNFIDPLLYSGDEGTWQTFLSMFFPIVLIAWQYNFRAVIGYCFLFSGLEVLMLHLGNYQWFHQISYQRSVSVRVIVFLVVGYVIALIMQRQREQRRSLIEANRQLRHYAATLEQLAVTQERNRMSRELHDTLAHTLSGLAVQLEGTRSLWHSAPERSYAMLEDSLQATRNGLTESRKAIQALRASPLEDLGLALAIRSLGENAASQSGAGLSLELPPNLEKLAPDVEQCIFRVAQESLENIVRHAEARHISIQLKREDPRLVLTISDDGQGFDPAQVDAQKHFGLKGLHERVEMFSGELQIHSQAGKGTTIRLILEHGL